MNKKNRIILAAILMLVLAIIVIAQFTTPEYQKENVFCAGKISEMANYLNAKYACHVTVDDCVYFRKEDYSYHDAFLHGTTYDIPNIAIFDYNGKCITVTDRNGFFGDDAQLEELNRLLCGYFEELTGLETAFVEVRLASNGNIKDATLNQILHHQFNEKLTPENIGEFVAYIWDTDWLELIFYYQVGEDLEQQVQQITQQLYQFSKHSNVRSMRFYITDMEQLSIYYQVPRVHTQSSDENGRESDEKYIWGHYHVVNDVEHHYPISEAAVYQVKEFNSFLIGGYCKLDRGYGAAFGNREIQTVNHFGVVDLSDAALAGYLEEMVSYGQYRGYTVLFREGTTEALSQLTIADGDKYRWTFHWTPGPVELYAFKHGRLLELETAYECGYLSPDDMDQILQAHKDHYAQHYNSDYPKE